LIAPNGERLADSLQEAKGDVLPFTRALRGAIITCHSVEAGVTNADPEFGLGLGLNVVHTCDVLGGLRGRRSDVEDVPPGIANVNTGRLLQCKSEHGGAVVMEDEFDVVLIEGEGGEPVMTGNGIGRPADPQITAGVVTGLVSSDWLPGYPRSISISSISEAEEGGGAASLSASVV